jgi:hypothetical protein
MWSCSLVFLYGFYSYIIWLAAFPLAMVVFLACFHFKPTEDSENIPNAERNLRFSLLASSIFMFASFTLQTYLLEKEEVRYLPFALLGAFAVVFLSSLRGSTDLKLKKVPFFKNSSMLKDQFDESNQFGWFYCMSISQGLYIVSATCSSYTFSDSTEGIIIWNILFIIQLLFVGSGSYLARNLSKKHQYLVEANQILLCVSLFVRQLTIMIIGDPISNNWAKVLHLLPIMATYGACWKRNCAIIALHIYRVGFLGPLLLLSMLSVRFAVEIKEEYLQLISMITAVIMILAEMATHPGGNEVDFRLHLAYYVMPFCLLICLPLRIGIDEDIIGLLFTLVLTAVILLFLCEILPSKKSTEPQEYEMEAKEEEGESKELSQSLHILSLILKV